MKISDHRSIKIGDRIYTAGEERDFLEALAGADAQVICRQLLAYESSGALHLGPDTLEAVEEAAEGSGNGVVDELSAEARRSDHIDSGQSLLDMLGKARTEDPQGRSDGKESADAGGQPDQGDSDEGGDTASSEADAESGDSEPAGGDLPTHLSDKQRRLLLENNYATAADLEGATVEELTEIKGIGPANAKEILGLE